MENKDVKDLPIKQVIAGNETMLGIDGDSLPFQTPVGQFIGTSGTIPIGGIILWSGEIAQIPAGWALCDGMNGTPNLSGRFVVCVGKRSYNPPDSVLNIGSTESPTNTRDALLTIDYKRGFTGGANAYAINNKEMPKHGHSFTLRSKSNPGDQNQSGLGHAGGGADVLKFTDINGYDNPHENRPPFYALAYIMRIS